MVFICLDELAVSNLHLFASQVMGARFAFPDSSAPLLHLSSKVLVFCSADILSRTFSVSSSGSRALVVFPCSLSGFGVRTMTPCDMNLRVPTSGFFCKRRIDSYSLLAEFSREAVSPRAHLQRRLFLTN